MAGFDGLSFAPRMVAGSFPHGDACLGTKCEAVQVRALGGVKDLLNRPAELYASINSVAGQSKFSRPFGYSEVDALMLKSAIDAPVILLRPARSPTAIFGRVSSFVVDTVKGLAFWPRAHIGIECLEGCPLLADGNPSAAVFSVFSGARIFAPLPHRMPSGVFWRLAHIMDIGFSRTHMLGTQTGTALSFAPARNSMPVHKVVVANRFPRAASTLASPMLIAFRIFFDYKKKPVFFAYHTHSYTALDGDTQGAF